MGTCVLMATPALLDQSPCGSLSTDACCRAALTAAASSGRRRGVQLIVLRLSVCRHVQYTQITEDKTYKRVEISADSPSLNEVADTPVRQLSTTRVDTVWLAANGMEKDSSSDWLQWMGAGYLQLLR